MQFPSQPDEGYSEDPLNTSSGSGGVTAMSSVLSSPPAADLTACLNNLRYLPASVKAQLAAALLDELPTSMVSEIAKRLHPRLYINFIQYLPPEVCLKVLGYLDPVSLLAVARSCRGWYGLAMDRKLWEKLYHLEGWQAIYSEIEAWEDKKNSSPARGNIRRTPSAVSSHHRIMASEGGHTRKKRAISEENDLEMTDADRTSKPEEPFLSNSIFGSPAVVSQGRTSSNPSAGSSEMDLDRNGDYLSAGSKGKGKAVDNGDAANPAKPISDLLKSEIWTWDEPSAKYRLNWKHAYTLRRRLEANWEHGRYVNFQFPRPDHPEEGHQECIYTLQFDPKYLVSGSRDRTIRIWSMNTRRLVRAPLRGHEGSVLCLQFDADPSEDLIVSGSSDSNVILWRFSTGEIIQRLTRAHTESVLNVRFDKRILVTCSKDKSIKVFNRRPLKFGDMGYDNPELLNSVPIRVRDPRFHNPADELPIKPAYTMIGRLEGHGAAVNAVQIHHNEIVSASGDRNIKVWDWTKQVCSRTVVGHGKGIACVQYDGRRIVSGSSDNEVKVFDRFTGLEVASLRAHTNLVRTVQAGFGDLPYSEAEDKAEARKIDAEYFKALESGIVSTDRGGRRSRSRPNNAGSRRPEDIMTVGATLPPGGGGGKYARIVSGSYDQKIIIWRRDKDGVWGPAHRLRQEEAAEAAQQFAVQSGSVPRAATTPAATNPPTNNATAPASMTANTGPPPAPAGTSADNSNPASTSPNLPLHPSARPAPSASAPAPRIPQASESSASQTNPSTRSIIESPVVATVTSDSAASFRALIDIVVPRGVAALQQALAGYPTMLAYHSHIQAAIARESAPHVRSQLRHVVNNAMQESVLAQARTRVASLQSTTSSTQIVPPSLPPLPSLPSQASSNMSADATQGSTTSASTSTATSHRGGSRAFDPVRHAERQSRSEPPAGSSTASPDAMAGHPDVGTYYAQGPQFGGHIHVQGSTTETSQLGASTAQPSQGHYPTPQAPSAPVQSHSTPVSRSQGGSSTQNTAQQATPQQQGAHADRQPTTTATATAAAASAGGVAGPANATAPAAQTDGAATHHPHLAGHENTAARVFKLQFDARRIICCSQTSVIVGWDFCNGDPELEEASRIFAPLE